MSKVCLIVDDVEVSRYASRTIIEDMGFEVLEAEDAEGCMAQIRKSRPSVILLDWHLRKESGIELIGRIRQQPGASVIPIIVFSGVENEDAASAAKAAGAASFLKKPTNEEKLQTEFKKLDLI